jgi:hypothetical protein
MIFWRDRLIRYATLLAIILHLSQWVLIFVKLMPMVGSIDYLSLHYNIYFGVDLIGSWKRVFVFPAAGLIFLVLNAFIAAGLYKKEKFLSYILFLCSPLINAGILVALVLIILLNI